ncbi:MAG: hypothetical protein ACRC0F_01885 [Cetobacterium sp.]
MNELRLKDYTKYNPEVHKKHFKGYTTDEVELILRKMSLADLSVVLGRTAKAIAEARKRFKMEGKWKKLNKNW